MSWELSLELLRNSITGLAAETDYDNFYICISTQAPSKDVLADIEVLLDVVQFQHMVPDTTVTHMSSDSLISYGKMSVPVSDIVGLATPPIHIVQQVSSGSGFAKMDKQVCA